ncbi:MAG TPA: universal stress protein [Candidatus Binatia bacterium]|nr:universal stress protein [Candidatus Binatia bacterium]
MNPGAKNQPRQNHPKLKGMPRQVRHILVPTDFSPISRKAMRYAQHFRAPVTLLHVIPPLVYEADYGYGVVTRRITDPAVEGEAQRRVRSITRGKAKPACKWQPLVRCGSAVEEIVQAARQLKTDLIVMGESGAKHGELSQALTTAQQTARHVPCPVLVVREHGTELLKNRKD